MDDLKVQLQENILKQIESKTIHLGIFTEPCLSDMLNGKKTIESRFSKHQIIPYNQISKDDIVIVKKSGGNVIAYFTIKEILFFNLKEYSINQIKNKYNKQLCVPDEFWIQKKDSNFATLIVIDKVIKLKPFAIHKKGMQTWIKLSK